MNMSWSMKSYLMEMRNEGTTRMKTSKVDATELKKMLRAFGIMLLDYTGKAKQHRTPEYLKITLLRNRAGKSSCGTDLVDLKNGSARTKSITYSRLESWDIKIPNRCENFLRVIRAKYPRLSEFADKDLTQVVELSEVNEESLAWAEHIAKSENVDLRRDTIYKVIVTTSTEMSSYIDTTELKEEIDAEAFLDKKYKETDPMYQLKLSDKKEDIKKAFILKVKKDKAYTKCKARDVISRVRQNKVNTTYSKVEIVEI